MLAIRPINQLQLQAAGPIASRLRIAIFIEHDIIYRHFIQSGVFTNLARTHDVCFVFPRPGTANKRLSVAINADELPAPHRFIDVDQQRLFYWRRWFQVSQLVWRPGADWKHLRRVARYLIGRNAAIVYGLMALPGIFPLFRWWSQQRIDQLPCSIASMLARLDPDVIIHPTVLDGYFINDLVLLGRRQRIPTIAIMNSWDNPSTKRAVIGQPDWLLVWGPQTRSHAITFMGMQPDRVIAFGAAQFEVHRSPPRLSRQDFCQQHGIAQTKRLLLYAGSSKLADEFAHLCAIEQAIEAGELDNIVVIYRPHPWGGGGLLR